MKNNFQPENTDCPKIEEYIKSKEHQFDERVKPIFEIFMIQNANKELVYKNGTHSGFPDLGSTDRPGFYYELETAMRAMNENWGDIRDASYNAGFVICRFPGLYDAVGYDGRIYFRWDDKIGGFFEQEEPEIFKHAAL